MSQMNSASMAITNVDEVITVDIVFDDDEKFTLTSAELPGLLIRSISRDRLIEDAPCVIEGLYAFEHKRDVDVQPAMMKRVDGEGKEINCFVARAKTGPELLKAA